MDLMLVGSRHDYRRGCKYQKRGDVEVHLGILDLLQYMVSSPPRCRVSQKALSIFLFWRSGNLPRICWCV